MKEDIGGQNLESAGVMLISTDGAGAVTFANRRARDVLECSPEQVLGTHLLEGFLRPDTLEEVRESFRRLMAGDREPADHYETPILTGTGKERIVAWRSSLLRDEEGKIVGVLSAGEDITERQMQRKKAERSETRLRSLIDGALDGYFCVEYDPPIPTDLPMEEQVRLMYGGILTECNQAYASLEGAIGPGELIGKTLTEVTGIVPGSLDGPWSDYVRNGYVNPGREKTVPFVDGRVRHFLGTAHGVVENGMLVRTWGTLRDLSETKMAEKAHREAETRFRKVFEESPIGMLVVGPDYHISHVNDSLCRMLGYEAEEILGQPLQMLWHPEEVETNMDRARRRRCGEIPSTLFGTRYRAKDRRTLHVEVSVSVVRDDQGEAQDCLAMVMDMTERKLAERELQRARAEAVRSNQLRAMGEMASGMAHGLNQSLVGIRGSAEHLSLALERGWDVTKENLGESLNSIVQEADRMSSMIDHTREFARGAQQAPDQPIHVNGVVQSCVDMVGPGILGLEIELECELGEGVSPVLGNPYALEDVILNLLSNARAAVENGKGGDHPPETRKIRISTVEGSSGEEPVVTIRVVDTGVGMPGAVAERVFEPFFTTRSAERGMGLGLTIAESVVQRMGGSIGVESEPGRGTTVTVRLPALKGV